MPLIALPSPRYTFKRDEFTVDKNVVSTHEQSTKRFFEETKTQQRVSGAGKQQVERIFLTQVFKAAAGLLNDKNQSQNHVSPSDNHQVSTSGLQRSAVPALKETTIINNAKDTTAVSLVPEIALTNEEQPAQSDEQKPIKVTVMTGFALPSDNLPCILVHQSNAKEDPGNGIHDRQVSQLSPPEQSPTSRRSLCPSFDRSMLSLHSLDSNVPDMGGTGSDSNTRSRETTTFKMAVTPRPMAP